MPLSITFTCCPPSCTVYALPCPRAPHASCRLGSPSDRLLRLLRASHQAFAYRTSAPCGDWLLAGPPDAVSLSDGLPSPSASAVPPSSTRTRFRQSTATAYRLRQTPPRARADARKRHLRYLESRVIHPSQRKAPHPPRSAPCTQRWSPSRSQRYPNPPPAIPLAPVLRSPGWALSSKDYGGCERRVRGPAPTAASPCLLACPYPDTGDRDYLAFFSTQPNRRTLLCFCGRAAFAMLCVCRTLDDVGVGHRARMDEADEWEDPPSRLLRAPKCAVGRGHPGTPEDRVMSRRKEGRALEGRSCGGQMRGDDGSG
ncbi:hypothetical protein C8Q80DRAFT_642986 [Daedaleopsis nitida]|nr:hypothetical protein C8Q80DRAFT_642986 [Daedaleopsis nitida]